MEEEFREWLARRSPKLTWDPPHLGLALKMLATLKAGGRLMVCMPPRHGKTQLVTIHFPIWRLERKPDMRIILAAYNQRLANHFSRRARRLWTPATDLSRECRGAEEWETTAGGGIRAVGVGGGVTGHGADLIVIDDPVKSREEADSIVFRDRVWDWYRDDLYTRLEPGGQIALVMTRWHEDDLAGRILTGEDGADWTVLRLPALADTQEERDFWARRHLQPSGQPDRLNREPGKALWPERFSPEVLARTRRVLGERGFQALYQQRPTALEGSLFRREWLRFVEAAPECERWCRGWDKAATEGGGDYTAGVLIGRGRDGIFYVADVVRGQWGPGPRERRIQATAARDEARAHTLIAMEEEPGSGGKDSLFASRQGLAGYSIRSEKATGSKLHRAEPLASSMESGLVALVKGPWTAAFVDELLAFPEGRHDDQVDAAATAFRELNRSGIRVRTPAGEHED